VGADPPALPAGAVGAAPACRPTRCRARAR
jgi:hypothetical protein